MSDINFRENLAKIGIDTCKDMIEQSKEDTVLLLEKGYKPKYIEWEKDFRQWCREEIEKDKRKMLDKRS